MIHKLIEWDKRRKFGHKFGDFIILLCFCIMVNMAILYITGKFNIVVLILSLTFYEILVNRDPPDEETNF